MWFGRLPRRSCRAPMTGLRPRRIPNRHCWPRSTGSTALPPASNPLGSTTATLVSSLTETGRLWPMRDGDRTMTNRTPVGRYRTLRLLGTLAGLSVVLGACNYTTGEVVTASVPNDYRQRHPIAITETNRSVVIFVGQTRGGLTVPQRSDVMGLARTWVSEGTGAIVADVPVDTANARAAAAAFREAQGILAAGGVPASAIKLRHYHPDDIRTLPTIR